MGNTADRFARLSAGFTATVESLGAYMIEPAWGLDLVVREDGMAEGDKPLRVKWSDEGRQPVAGDRVRVTAQGKATVIEASNG